MGVAGAKPKEDRSQIRHRNPPAHDWTEVADVPFDGPPLPPRETVYSLDNPFAGGEDAPGGEWPRRTREWWEAIRQMPHAKLWSSADWQFAFDVAEIHARFTQGWKGYNGAELRMREKLLGNTMDARRDLRIRYIPKPEENVLPANVTRMADFRDL
jgi:hypothetical protein